jgi:hypothetical protein
MIDKCLLQLIQVIVLCNPFHRGNLMAVGLYGQNQARIDRLPIQKNGAGSAVSQFTTLFCPGKIEVVPQGIDKQCVGLHNEVARVAVYY